MSRPGAAWPVEFPPPTPAKGDGWLGSAEPAEAPLARLVRRRDPRMPALVAALAAIDGLLDQPVDAAAGSRVQVGGRWVLSFAATDYLGLARDPRVAAAAARAVGRWGVSLATPHVLAVDGLTRRLEPALARLVGQPAACVFPSTTHAALDVLPLLAGPRGVLFIDEWAYPISVDGARLAAQRGARLERFPHDDVAALARLLARHASNPDEVIVCDGVYPVGGQPAPLRAMDALAREHDAVVYVDYAHGISRRGARPGAAPRLGRLDEPRGDGQAGPGGDTPLPGTCPYGQGGGGTPRFLVQPQTRSSVAGYARCHEAPCVRASLDGRRARPVGGWIALVRCVGPPPLPDSARRRRWRAGAAPSSPAGLRSPDRPQRHRRVCAAFDCPLDAHLLIPEQVA